ncbi:MAG: RecX family transcriptional regulator [Alphaproteobacteria bacterium]
MPLPTAASLRAAALHYLARYATSSGNLRRMLRRRIARAALQHPELDAAAQARLCAEAEQIIAACIAQKYLDDAAYAAQQTRRARAQGKSARFVVARLRQKGLTPPQIAAALDTIDKAETAATGAETTAPGDPEYQAALRLARRRKLGPYRATPGDAAQIRRDYATFARAGFSSTIARRVLQADLDEEEG